METILTLGEGSTLAQRPECHVLLIDSCDSNAIAYQSTRYNCRQQEFKHQPTTYNSNKYINSNRLLGLMLLLTEAWHGASAASLSAPGFHQMLLPGGQRHWFHGFCSIAEG